VHGEIDWLADGLRAREPRALQLPVEPGGGDHRRRAQPGPTRADLGTAGYEVSKVNVLSGLLGGRRSGWMPHQDRTDRLIGLLADFDDVPLRYYGSEGVEVIRRDR
jgi:hypothetical protein